MAKHQRPRAENSPYNGAITREQFLFYEMRTAARLCATGFNEEEIINRIVTENLFQYPTERSLRKMAQVCLRRLDGLEDDVLVAAIADGPSGAAKQICLYAMMRQYRLVWDFMITVIGEKYRTLDMTFGKKDMDAFFSRLQEQDDRVAGWSDSTVARLKQIFRHILAETEYLETVRSEVLQPVLIRPELESAIRANGDDAALVAFNCFA